MCIYIIRDSLLIWTMMTCKFLHMSYFFSLIINYNGLLTTIIFKHYLSAWKLDCLSTCHFVFVPYEYFAYIVQFSAHRSQFTNLQVRFYFIGTGHAKTICSMYFFSFIYFFTLKSGSIWWKTTWRKKFIEKLQGLFFPFVL